MQTTSTQQAASEAAASAQESTRARQRRRIELTAAFDARYIWRNEYDPKLMTSDLLRMADDAIDMHAPDLTEGEIQSIRPVYLKAFWAEYNDFDDSNY